MIITAKQLTEALTGLGWKADKYQHLQKAINVTRPFDGFPLGKTELIPHRIRMDSASVWVETKHRRTPTSQNPSRTEWKVIERESWDAITVTEGGHIKIGQKLF